MTLSPGLERLLVLHAGERGGAPVDARGLAGEAARLDESGGVTVLKDATRSRVLAGTLGRDEVVIKIAPAPGWGRRVLERFGVFRSKPRRHVRGAALLSDAGIATAPVLALVRGRNTHGRLVDTLIMFRLAGRDALRAYRDAGPRAGREIAVSVGRLTHRMRLAGLTNRDHKPSNIIVLERDGAGREVRVALIDTVGVRRGRASTPRLLFNLFVECVGTGVHVSLTDRMRTLLSATGAHAAGDAGQRTEERKRGDRTARGIIWRLAGKRLAAHGDPTPVDGSPAPEAG